MTSKYRCPSLNLKVKDNVMLLHAHVSTVSNSSELRHGSPVISYKREGGGVSPEALTLTKSNFSKILFKVCKVYQFGMRNSCKLGHVT